MSLDLPLPIPCRMVPKILVQEMLMLAMLLSHPPPQKNIWKNHKAPLNIKGSEKFNNEKFLLLFNSVPQTYSMTIGRG
jgi:hypothetical protein